MTVPSEAADSNTGGSGACRASGRKVARRRCTLLLCLTGVAAVATALVSFFPESAAPISTGATVMALAPIAQARYGASKERQRPPDGP